jgi:hypothetical protein
MQQLHCAMLDEAQAGANAQYTQELGGPIVEEFHLRISLFHGVFTAISLNFLHYSVGLI